MIVLAAQQRRKDFPIFFLYVCVDVNNGPKQRFNPSSLPPPLHVSTMQIGKDIKARRERKVFASLSSSFWGDVLALFLFLLALHCVLIKEEEGRETTVPCW